MFDCDVVRITNCTNFSKSGKELFKVQKEKVFDCSALAAIVQFNDIVVVAIVAPLHVITAVDADVIVC